MTIKSDRWIRAMAAKGMIEPFEPGQVRENEGGKVISYGTSSYGYDVRCAPQFKVFTNIFSATVDPKAFDERLRLAARVFGEPIVVFGGREETTRCRIPEERHSP